MTALIKNYYKDHIFTIKGRIVVPMLYPIKKPGLKSPGFLSVAEAGLEPATFGL